MFGRKEAPDHKDKYEFWLSGNEVDLLRECIMRTENYYRGLLLLKQDWNPEKNEEAIAILKVKLRMIDQLQEVLTYAEQPEKYKNMK